MHYRGRYLKIKAAIDELNILWSMCNVSVENNLKMPVANTDYRIFNSSMDK